MKASCQLQNYSTILGKLVSWPFEKTHPLVCLMLAGILFFPSSIQAQSKRKKLKEEKAAAAQLKAQIMHHLTQLQAIEQQNIPGYFQEFMEQKVITPLNNNQFADSFVINEGNDYRNNNTSVSLNGISLQAGTDFFPLHFSSNTQIIGSAAPALNESGAPWFRNLSDIIHEHAQDPKFDFTAYCIKESKRAAAKGASALLFYNTDSSFQNAITFNPFQRNDSLPIPIVCITPSGWCKSNADEVNTMDINVSVSIQPKTFRSVNYVSFINHHADSTLILYTRQPVEGLATLLSLTDVLQKQTKLNYVLVYQPYQPYHLANTGLLNQLETIHSLHCQYAIEIMADTTTKTDTFQHGYYTQALSIPLKQTYHFHSTENQQNVSSRTIPGIQYLFTKNCLTNSTEEKTLVILGMIRDIQTQITTGTNHIKSKP